MKPGILLQNFIQIFKARLPQTPGTAAADRQAAFLPSVSNKRPFTAIIPHQPEDSQQEGLEDQRASQDTHSHCGANEKCWGKSKQHIAESLKDCLEIGNDIIQKDVG